MVQISLHLCGAAQLARDSVAQLSSLMAPWHSSCICGTAQLAHGSVAQLSSCICGCGAQLSLISVWQLS